MTERENIADPHGDRIATTEARLEGFYWVILGQNPPEIAYWERGECGWRRWHQRTAHVTGVGGVKEALRGVSAVAAPQAPKSSTAVLAQPGEGRGRCVTHSGRR